MSIWHNAIEIRNRLANDGWHSPDTYDDFFAPIGSEPAVYLFLLTDAETFDRAFVAYVGMSVVLAQRMSGHQVLGELRQSKHWPMRWFKPTAKSDLRRVERSYIERFDPPWNIVGRKRGVPLA